MITFSRLPEDAENESSRFEMVRAHVKCGEACACPKLCRRRSCCVSVFVDESVAAGGSDDLCRRWGRISGAVFVG